jgi:hypothetical protein
VNPLITDGVVGLAELIAAIPSTVDDPRINVDFREQIRSDICASCHSVSAGRGNADPARYRTYYWDTNPGMIRQASPALTKVLVGRYTWMHDR